MMLHLEDMSETVYSMHNSVYKLLFCMELPLMTLNL